MISISEKEKYYLGEVEIKEVQNGDIEMISKKNSTDEIQFCFDMESLKNRSGLVHPHLIGLKRFSIENQKVNSQQLTITDDVWEDIWS
jgi:predicted transcriptional regulator